MEFIEFRERLRKWAPEHVFDLWFEREDKIWDKYQLTEWQQIAYNNALKEVFLKEISIITFPNEIKNRLKIKDENITNSISLDTAIHVFSLAKDYFRHTDNLIKSLGGEEEYWKKYSPNYWNEIKVAEPLITKGDMKNAYDKAKLEISKAEIALKELEEQYNAKDFIPELFNKILIEFGAVKAKLDSEDYELIFFSERLALSLIDDIKKAKTKASEAEKERIKIKRRNKNKDIEKKNKNIEKKRIFNSAKGFIVGGLFGYILNNESITHIIHILIYILITIFIIHILWEQLDSGFLDFLGPVVGCSVIVTIILAIIFWVLGAMGLDSFVSMGLFFSLTPIFAKCLCLIIDPWPRYPKAKFLLPKHGMGYDL